MPISLTRENITLVILFANAASNELEVEEAAGAASSGVSAATCVAAGFVPLGFTRAVAGFPMR